MPISAAGHRQARRRRRFDVTMHAARAPNLPHAPPGGHTTASTLG
jgi:hypothetical protein